MSADVEYADGPDLEQSLDGEWVAKATLPSGDVAIGVGPSPEAAREMLDGAARKLVRETGRDG